MAPYGQRTVLGDHTPEGYLGRVTNPLGQSARISYSTDSSAEGLVATFTATNGASSTMTYDDMGRITKDQDVVGGFKELTLSDTSGNSSTLDVSTALSKTTRYRFERIGDKNRDTITGPDSTKTTSELTSVVNARTTRTTYDGTTRLYETSSPAGLVTRRYIEDLGRTTRIEHNGILPTVFGYDS